MILQRNYDFSAFPIQTLRIYIKWTHFRAHCYITSQKRDSHFGSFQINFPAAQPCTIAMSKKRVYLFVITAKCCCDDETFSFINNFPPIQIMDENLRAQKNCLHLSRVNSYIRLMIHFKLSERQKKKHRRHRCSPLIRRLMSTAVTQNINIHKFICQHMKMSVQI